MPENIETTISGNAMTTSKPSEIRTPSTAAWRMCSRYHRLPGARRTSSKTASGQAIYAPAAREYSSGLFAGDEDSLCSEITRGPVRIFQLTDFNAMAARAMNEATVAEIDPNVGRSVRIRLEEDQ